MRSNIFKNSCNLLKKLLNFFQVDQVSKSIADVASGRLLLNDKIKTIPEWLIASNLNHSSLVKRAAWSILHFNSQSHAELLPSDIDYEFLSADQNAKLEGNLKYSYEKDIFI